MENKNINYMEKQLHTREEQLAAFDRLLTAMDTLRAAADAAEELVVEDYWPLPCYSRMLFYTE